jgi:hypothetical protein
MRPAALVGLACSTAIAFNAAPAAHNSSLRNARNARSDCHVVRAEAAPAVSSGRGGQQTQGRSGGRGRGRGGRGRGGRGRAGPHSLAQRNPTEAQAAPVSQQSLPVFNPATLLPASVSEAEQAIDAADAELIAVLESALLLDELPAPAAAAADETTAEADSSSSTEDSTDAAAAAAADTRPQRKRKGSDESWQLALQTFKALCERTDRPDGAAPPRIAAGLALQVAAQCRRWDAGMEILELMQAHNIQPACCTYKVSCSVMAELVVVLAVMVCKRINAHSSAASLSCTFQHKLRLHHTHYQVSFLHSSCKASVSAIAAVA